MKAWRRADRGLPCGADPDCRIETGDPYLELAGEGWKKARCQRHAGHPVGTIEEDEQRQRPAVQDPKRASTRELAATVRMGPKLLKFAQATVDVKAAQAHDVEDDPNG